MLSGMKFNCKLAHQDEIVQVSGFSSIKELYEKVSQIFSITIDKILYCTINTHDFRNMDALLANYLSLGDTIIVHVCGAGKESNLKKTQEYLGLTITDNGIGRAFVKKVNSEDELVRSSINPGDHIAAVNSDSTIGMRHFEVAKAIRDVPQMTNFTLHLIKPLFSEKYLNELTNNENKSTVDLKSNANASSKIDSSINTTSIRNLENDTKAEDFYLENEMTDSIYEDLANSSLPIDRLLSKGTCNNQKNDLNASTISTSKTAYRGKIEMINSILESFLGINDNTLAIQLYRLAKENKDSKSRFSKAIKNSELGVFNFDEEIETYLWNCAESEE